MSSGTDPQSYLDDILSRASVAGTYSNREREEEHA